MSDHFEFERWKGIRAASGKWYEAIELIAVGKNAAAFLAIGASPPFVGIPYAIKVFRRVSNKDSLKAFLGEAQYLKELSHPCVMSVIDDGVYYHKNPFIVAEYLPNTLRDVIRQGTSLQNKLGFALQLVSALRYLDSLSPKIVHRDLKPENIFVRGKSCVIGDFGLKKVLSSSDVEDVEAIKMTGGPGMPLKYRTPELVRYYRREIHVDLSKSDIFQLGLTLAELFTGINPQLPASDYADEIQMEKVSYIDAGQVAAGISGMLRKMLHLDPAKRPSPASLERSWKKIFCEVVDNHLYLHSNAFVAERERE